MIYSFSWKNKHVGSNFLHRVNNTDPNFCRIKINKEEQRKGNKIKTRKEEDFYCTDLQNVNTKKYFTACLRFQTEFLLF